MSAPKKTSTTPWNNWFHVTGCAYGAWLPGDPRGFRTRHHREHIAGDYKRPPPPGSYDDLHARSKRLMKRPPVRLSKQAQRVALESIVETLHRLGADPAAACLDDHHFHILAKFPQRNPRAIIGHAKRRSARTLSEASLAPPGGVWATRSRAEPIVNRNHAVAVHHYIQRHASHGALVMTTGGTGGLSASGSSRTSLRKTDYALVGKPPVAPFETDHDG